MIHTVNQILEMMEKQGHPNYKLLKGLVDRDVPLEGYQANLMYFKRGYGKTWMGYAMVAAQMFSLLGEQGTVSIASSPGKDINITYYDPDLTLHSRKQQWLHELTKFIEKYFPDVELIKNDSSSSLLVYRMKDNG